MEARTTVELLEALGKMGDTTISSLILRLTGSVKLLFDSLSGLKREGLVEVEDDSGAIDAFFDKARELEGQGLDPDELREKIFEALRTHAEAGNAQVRLTKAGFTKGQLL